MSENIKSEGFTMLKSLLSTTILLALMLSGCSKEQFSTKKKQEVQSSNPIQINSSSTCSAFTYIKPKVDFLFLWDNSTSSVFINSQTKNALNNTIDLISSRFDYHIMMAPLMGSGNNEAKFMSETPDGLNQSALNIKIDRTQAANSLNFSYVPGNAEAGVQRSIDLIRNNTTNGIFRPNSYVVIVVMSNEDDNSWATSYPPADADRVLHVRQKVNDLMCLRGNYNPPAGYSCQGFSLNSLQMRFMSIVAYNDYGGSNTCGGISYWKRNLVYKEVASKVYTTPYTNGVSQNDQSTRTDLYTDPFLGIVNFDSYDICSQSSFSGIFDGINASINDTLIAHKYNYWPVASAGASAIDPDEIKVFKDGVEIPRLTSPGIGTDGFYFENYVQTRNTRYSPTPGEPFTGYLIRLYGNAEVTYPQCLTVTTQSPKEFFGYINMQTKPLENTIQVKINGQTVPKSTTNGWQLVKSNGQPHYYNSKNIKIQSAGSTCPTSIEPQGYCGASPAINKSGYFLQVFGTAVYSNGAQVEVIYDPSS